MLDSVIADLGFPDRGIFDSNSWPDLNFVNHL